MLKKKLLLVFFSGFIFLLLIISSASPQRRVSINEIAWGGTKANPYDEWIELRNNTEKDILLDGWKLLSESGEICILLSGIIPAKGFFLLERSDDNTISDIPCNMIYRGNLSNKGDTLKLINEKGEIEDTANKDGGRWPAGCGSPEYISMERVNPLGEDIPSNWKNNDCKTVCGLDVKGNPISGTPASENSVFLNFH